MKHLRGFVLGVTSLTFRRFRSVLASVSVLDARLRGLRGTSCVTEAKLDREAQLFHRWRWEVVVSSLWTRRRRRTTGSRTTGKEEVKDCTNAAEVGSDGSFLVRTIPEIPEGR